MISVTTVFTRPSTDVKFHVWHGLGSHISNNHAGGVLSNSAEFSNNFLTLTRTMVFASQAARTAWDQDPVVAAAVAEGRAVNQSNGITESDRVAVEM